ncbi:MAG: biosynthetic-type acetolactate synthase large subunit [Endomicrobiia bacterium]|nr:biosynthetic-type acetolactate synthase large subunit [Endomicrobiia bacterium]
MKLTGAQIFVESLNKLGVEVVFGIPGGQVLPLMDAIYSAPFKFILTRHEQGAAHMADGYARSTGKVGVCFATSGPGATNLVTGIATAYMDSVPIVAFTGQVATHLIGNDAFQEADITGITRPIVKHNFLVKDVKDLARTIAEAFYIASTGRPGPVLIDIPVDVQRAQTDFVWPQKVEIRSYKPHTSPNFAQIKRAAEAINASKKPVIYAGGGVISSSAHKELLKLSTLGGIPVTTTLLAHGAFPPSSKLWLGMLGMHGTYAANHAMQNADLIIAVGARFDDRCTGKLSGFAPRAANIIHIDIDPTSISKTVAATIPIVADARAALTELVKHVGKNSHPAWISAIEGWKKNYPLKYKSDDNLRGQYVIETLSRLTGGEAIAVTEVGQHQMWAAQFYKPSAPRGFLSSGGLGTMGYGFPAAIGAKAANPSKLVVDIAGDGSIQMNIQELATAVLNKIDVKIIILNNNYLGMVRQWQEMFYGRRYSAVCLHKNADCPDECDKPGRKGCPPYTPDFVRLAEAYGATGMRIIKKSEVESALKKIIASKGVVVAEFIIEQEENVLPMVPAGAALDEIITSLA